MAFKVLIFGSFLIFSCFGYAQNVATVGGKTISLKEFQQKYNEVKQKSVINVPSKELFLEDLVL